MKQRPTQTSTFWETQFEIPDSTIEALYNRFLETGESCYIDEVCLFFVNQTLEAEEKSIQAELEQGKIYQPHLQYEVGEKLLFAQFNYILGTVQAIHPGYNPIDEDFSVLEVVFDELNKTQITASFAAGLKTTHFLSQVDGQSEVEQQSASATQKIYGQFQQIIRPKVEKTLRKNSEFVEFNHNWFLSGLLIEIQEGLLNIVDAAIDINAAPLDVDELIKQIELQKNGQITDALRFSVNYCLASDSRFINVGTEYGVLWYLNRLKPPEVMKTPHNLVVKKHLSFDEDALESEHLALLQEIDDEATPEEFSRPAEPQSNDVTLVLNYPHRRSGTLPVVPIVRHLLPVTDNPLTTLQLIDGQTGDEMVGWYIRSGNYIFGLKKWYEIHSLPVGTFITLQKTETPVKFVVNFIPQRNQQEWVRVASVQNDHLVFTMKKKNIACHYDELMVIGEEGSEYIDALWTKLERNQTSLYSLLVHIFPELMKLSAQSAVHFKTLYSAVNVTRRCPPGPLIEELNSHPVFVWMGHGYWTYKS